jgi:hypothetical protein
VGHGALFQELCEVNQFRSHAFSSGQGLVTFLIHVTLALVSKQKKKKYVLIISDDRLPDSCSHYILALSLVKFNKV